MPDYKAMYYKLFHAVTKAEQSLQSVASSLRTAQQECEDLYISTDETPLTFPSKPD